MMLSRLDGNIFVNSIVLSFAEAISMAITGIGMTYYKDTNVSRVCAIFIGVFNFVYFYFTGPENPILQYAVLFLALVGQAGAYNCIFVIMELRIPPKNLGSAMNIITLVIGPTSYGFIPYIKMMNQPWPLYATLGMAASAFICTFLVCEPGKYLPKLDVSKTNSED